MTFAARALFALLLIATIAAFFVAQRIKQSTPVVEKVAFTKWFSPNGDGIRERTALRFRLKRTDSVDVEIVDRRGDLVRRVASDRSLCGPCTHRFSWNGRRERGGLAPDGEYYLRVVLREEARSVTSPRKIFLDTTAPKPHVRAITPDAISPDGDGRADSARIVYEGPAGEAGGSTPATYAIYRTGRTRAQRVASFRGGRGERIARWNGRIGGRPAPPGNYLVTVRVRDAAGNLGGGPALEPRRGVGGDGAPGVRVRYLEAVAPERPILAGNRARFFIRTERDRYRWSIRRVGAGRLARRGSSSARGRIPLTPRVPGRPGIYLLELRAGAHSYRTPFAVRSPDREPLLVVLPAISWQASNVYDANQDGWGETLATDPAVARRRPIGLPAGVTSALGPLFGALDDARARFDVTTDLALVQGRGPGLGNRIGVLFAGDERFYPPRAGRELADYLRGGGRVAWLGPDSFHRRVFVEGAIRRGERRRRVRDVFGERTELERIQASALEPGRDAIGFFSEVLPAFGSFTEFERSIRLPPRARLLAAAGPPSGGLATPVYRLGQGAAARLNPPGFARQIASDPNARALIERLVRFLGGRR